MTMVDFMGTSSDKYSIAQDQSQMRALNLGFASGRMKRVSILREGATWPLVKLSRGERELCCMKG